MKSVWWIEDEKHLVSWLLGELRRQGVRVRLFGDIASVLEELGTGCAAPDCVIMDLILPLGEEIKESGVPGSFGGGLHVLRRLRARFGSSCRVCVLSGNLSPELERALSLDQGLAADAIFSKPLVDPTDFLEFVVQPREGNSAAE